MTSSAEFAAPPGFRHAAVLYDDPDRVVDGVVTFVREGLAHDHSVLVAELPEQTRAIQAGLGSDADRVVFVDMAEVGKNPACLIPLWLEFLSRNPGRPVRGVGEPAWVGRRPVELEECLLHEALLNVVFDDAADLTLLCPYDAGGLPADVVSGAMRTHPEVVAAPREATYGGHELAADTFGRGLPPAPSGAQELGFGAYDLVQLRATVRGLGERAQVSVDALDDLVLAAHELATNSVQHAGGSGVLRGWIDGDSLVVEVFDSGVVDDPLIGREQVLDLAEGGRGIWMANHLCDLVQVRSSVGGTTVRLHTWL